MENVRVILADPSPVVVSGLTSFLVRHPRISVLQEVRTLGNLQLAVDANAGCVSIVDWHLASMEFANSSETLKRIVQRSKLIFYAMPENVGARRQALRMGARGFIGKHQSANDIRKAVLRVASGDIWIDKTTAEALVNFDISGNRGRDVHFDRQGRLTPREIQVIHMVCRGLKSYAIARELRISKPTVGHHLTSIYSKLGVDDRVGLVIYAYRHSLQVPDMLAHVDDISAGFAPDKVRVAGAKHHSLTLLEEQAGAPKLVKTR